MSFLQANRRSVKPHKNGENLQSPHRKAGFKSRPQNSPFSKEHSNPQPLYSCARDDHCGAVLRRRGWLKSTQTELDRVRGTWKGAATSALQARVQHLEEMPEQERSYGNTESQRQAQKLAFIREEKRRLVRELDAVRSEDKHLRRMISELEVILHKMTEGFANGQEFIQPKEQEFFCQTQTHP